MKRNVSLVGVTLMVVTVLSYGSWRLSSPGEPSTSGEQVPQAEADQQERAGAPVARPARRSGLSADRRAAPVENPSFQELKTQAERLSVVELEDELAQLDARIENEDWINRANSDELSPAQRQDFALLLRQKNAIAVVLALRQVEALDLDEES